MLPRLIIAFAVILILISAILFSPKQSHTINNSNLVVFFGNSFTAGQGAQPGEDFPTLIGKRLNVPTINAGVSGNTTHDALLRIEKDVLSKNPSIVVVELGGNDLLDRVDSKVTQKTLDLILSKIKPTGAKIVILGVRFFLFNQKYETDLQKLAKKYNATFVPDILEGIITDQSLKHDDIHPNAKGYQKIADKLTPIIASLINQNTNASSSHKRLYSSN